MPKNRIGIQIVTSRPNYLAILLSSLLRQTQKNWDLVLVFEGDLVEDYAIKSLLTRMTLEGHRIKFVQVDFKGIGKLRNIALDHDDCEYGCRIDDDSWVEPDYLELLFSIFRREKKVGVVGGTVPLMGMELEYTRKPENWNKVSKHGVVFDHSYKGFNQLYGKHFPADHLRSSYMYKNEIMRKVKFPEQMDKYAGFREETLPCIKLKKIGYKNFIVPSARAWHFACQTGGCRDIWKQCGKEGEWEAEELFLKEVNYA